ncbi:hypothetical protein [Sporolactobacillus putidus]|uniref:Uncharacterized protein n=1 Tax=Sporolactobacillus putidus TaxID=492735 RepID=A0A917W2Y0_9BACL|nr:hypothetical protein [Sporolactobacillus putidus]GGL55815.1 hypothetical protein GCM10007968_19880 [Sporolactobacillus putidus]
MLRKELKNIKEELEEIKNKINTDPIIVSKIDVGKEDIIVLKIYGLVDEYERNLIREKLQTYFPDNKILIIDRSVNGLEVIKKAVAEMKVEI